MNSLQKVIEKGLSDLPVLGMANLLKSKLSEQGVKIGFSRVELIARRLLAGKSSLSLPGNRTEPLQITLTEQD